MKKVFKHIISFLFIISLVFLLFSCVDGFQHKHEYVDGVCNCGEKEPAKYTVVFKNYDGKTINSQQVEEGKDAVAPEDPTREGYVFTGWDIAFTNVTSDLVVTATFVEAGPTDASEAQFLGKICTYDGTEKELVVTGRLPEGYTVAYEANTATEVGTYYCTAIISDANGNVEKTLKAVLKIEKADDEAFNEWLDDFLVLYFEGDQLSCNLRFANPENFGLEHYEAVWMSYSKTDPEEASEYFQELYADLQQFENADLSQNQENSYRIIETFFLSNIEYYSNDYDGLGVGYISQFGGYPSELPTYMTGYSFRNEQDVKDAISIIKSVKDAFSTYVDYAKDMIEIGRAISDTTIDGMNGYLQQVVDAGDDYYLNQYFADKFASLDFLTVEQKDAYTSEIQEALKGDFIQAHKDLKEQLELLKGNCTQEGYLAAAGELGKEYYVYLLKDTLGISDINMEEYIAYLDSKILESINGLDKVMKAAEKFSDSEFNTLASIVNGVKSFVDGTPEEMLEYLKEFATTIVPDLQSSPEIHIAYMDDTVAEYNNALAYYLNSPLDTYDHEYITLNGLKLGNKNDILTTLAHEGYPGHLYSYVFTKESTLHNVNKFMKNVAFGEGWANYVELKLYDYIKESTVSKAEKAACDYLYYNLLLSYLAYSRADVGINYEGWNTTEIATYFNNIGYNFDEDSSKSLFDLLIEMPTQYQSYGYGMAAFNDVHKYAKQELGQFYNEIDFNRAIQSRGWVPMEIFYEIVEEYIVEQKILYGIE